MTGQHYADGYTDTVPVQRFIAPAVVIDCSKEAAADEKFLLEPAHHRSMGGEAWPYSGRRLGADAHRLVEARGSGAIPQHEGRRPARTGAVGGGGDDSWCTQRNVNGWGVEAVGTDAGQAFAFEPAFPAHHLMHGANKFGLASLCNLDQLPPTGADSDHAAAEDREGLRQPVAGAGAGAGIALAEFLLTGTILRNRSLRGLLLHGDPGLGHDVAPDLGLAIDAFCEFVGAVGGDLDAGGLQLLAHVGDCSDSTIAFSSSARMAAGTVFEVSTANHAGASKPA